MTATKLVNRNSLAATLANLNQALLQGNELSQSQRDEIADWIASRAGEPGSYGGLPAPTGRDYRTKLRLFTGETVGSRAGTGCKLGFEAAWALTALRPRRAVAVAAAELSRRRAIGLFARQQSRPAGMYCCYSCSIAGWRLLGIAPAEDGGKWLKAAMALLRSHRDGSGRWCQFPFWYALLALHDLRQPEAREELRYAVPACEQYLKRFPRRDAYARRRRILAKWILESRR